jgi:thiol-disulfide isomerase/thioredoxin
MSEGFPRPIQHTGPLMVMALLLATAVGCGPATQPADEEAGGNVPPGAEATNQTAPDSATTAGGTQPEITVRVVDVAEYDEVIAKHRGKVVLVDFWATWCTGCIAQFPHTVKLHEDLGDEGLAVVSVSLDDVADEAEVLKMLKRFGAEFDNLLSQHGGGTQSTDAFQIEGGLPCYKLYDRKGNLRYTLADTDPDNPLTSDDVDARVKELLAEEEPL